MTRLRAFRAVPVVLAFLELALGARPVLAQGGVSFTPYAGIFVPTRNSFAEVGNDIKRDNSFVGGARLTIWGKRPLGFEITAGYTPARVEVAGLTINGDRNTNVLLGSLKLMLGVSPASSALGIFLGLGPAFIRQGSDVLHANQSHTDLGGAVGAGVRIPMSHGAGLRLDIDDYLYGGNFSGSKRFQNDLTLTAGLSLAF